MIIIQVLALLAGLLATYFFFSDIFKLTFFCNKGMYQEVLKDLLFSFVIILICASITGVIQLNLNSTGVL